MRVAQEMVEAAAFAYQFEKYEGKMLLLLASERPPHVNFVPGWQAVVHRKLHTGYVDGHHRELMKAQNVRTIADAIVSHVISATDRESLSYGADTPGSPGSTCIDTMLGTTPRKVGMFGLTFKEGMDDLRESPAVELAETLIGKGLDLLIYEPAISPGSIRGTNLQFSERNIPHIWKLLTRDLETMVHESNVLVLLKKPAEGERLAFKGLRTDQTCIDFVDALGADEVRAQVAVFGVRQSVLGSTAAAAD